MSRRVSRAQVERNLAESLRACARADAELGRPEAGYRGLDDLQTAAGHGHYVPQGTVVEALGRLVDAGVVVRMPTDHLWRAA